MMHNAMWAGHWLWMVVFAIVIIIPFWRICQRVGYSGWWSLLVLFPLLNLGLLYFLAFADWPASARDRRGRERDERN